MATTSHLCRTVLSIALLAWCGCATTPPLTTQPAQAEMPISWEQSGTHSHVARAARIIVRDRATLAQVPVGEVPVDFETQMVLVAALGPTPGSDVGIRITRVWEQDGRLRVQERQIHPGREQERGLSPASPWTAVVIPRSDLNVSGYSPVVPPNLISGSPSDSRNVPVARTRNTRRGGLGLR